MGFGLTIELFLAAAQLLLTAQGRFNTFFDASAAHPLNCGMTNVQGVGDVIVLHGAAGLCRIAHEQNAGMGLFVGSDAPAGDQGLEFVLFFRGQFDTLFLGCHNDSPKRYGLLHATIGRIPS